jgi:hypothetical protein
MYVFIPGMNTDNKREDFYILSRSDSLYATSKRLAAKFNETDSKNSRSNSNVSRSSSTSSSSDNNRSNDDNVSQKTVVISNKRDNVINLENKSPVWYADLQTFALNFNGRVTHPSIKNFQIVHQNHPDYIVMQFGKVDKNEYSCDYSYPLCALQAFATAITSLDNKLGCD